MPGFRERLKKAVSQQQLHEVFELVIHEARAGRLSTKAQRRCKKVWEERSKELSK